MARPGRPERNRAARSFRQLRRFHHVINSNMVFGTHRVSARLQLECFISNSSPALQFGIVLPTIPPNGFMAWRYQYDDRPPVKTKPYSRSLPPESITLG